MPRPTSRPTRPATRVRRAGRCFVIFMRGCPRFRAGVRRATEVKPPQATCEDAQDAVSVRRAGTRNVFPGINDDYTW
jgi:hypothetical protein